MINWLLATLLGLWPNVSDKKHLIFDHAVLSDILSQKVTQKKKHLLIENEVTEWVD